MAVTADIILAVKISKSPDPTIRLANVHDTKFPARKFQVPVSGDIEIDARSLEWSNYFKSGLRGAIELLRKKGLLSGSAPVSMDILVDGTVPTGGGLSSSAAFVCASALATLIGNGVEKVDKEELVSLAVVSERHVGVNSGGYARISLLLLCRDPDNCSIEWIKLPAFSDYKGAHSMWGLLH